MAYTVFEYFETKFSNNWNKSVTGRIKDVPQPTIVKATSNDQTRVNVQADDYLIITKGGGSSVSPKSVGWVEEEITNTVAIDLRTTVSRERLEGTRDNNNERETYGGLRGESKRILDTIRKGDKEFDWIESTEWNNLSEDMGFGTWRGTWEVRLTEIAKDITV